MSLQSISGCLSPENPALCSTPHSRILRKPSRQRKKTLMMLSGSIISPSLHLCVSHDLRDDLTNAKSSLTISVPVLDSVNDKGTIESVNHESEADSDAVVSRSISPASSRPVEAEEVTGAQQPSSAIKPLLENEEIPVDQESESLSKLPEEVARDFPGGSDVESDKSKGKKFKSPGQKDVRIILFFGASLLMTIRVTKY